MHLLSHEIPIKLNIITWNSKKFKYSYQRHQLALLTKMSIYLNWIISCKFDRYSTIFCSSWFYRFIFTLDTLYHSKSKILQRDNRSKIFTSLSGTHNGVPGLTTPSYTSTPRTIGFFRLKTSTIFNAHGKTAFFPSETFLSPTHFSKYFWNFSQRW